MPATNHAASDAFLRELSSLAERLGDAARGLGLSTVAERIETDLHRRMQSGRLRVAVIGEIKHGKSSLINALAGGDVLPMGVTPTTGALVTVRASDGDRRYSQPADPSRPPTPLDAARFATLAKGGDADTAPEGMLIAEVNTTALPPEIELVDTPGLNDIAKFRSMISRDEFPRADVLLLVLDATQALRKSELALLRDAMEAVGGTHTSGATLEVVLNRIDLIAPDDVPTVVEHVSDKLATVLAHRPTLFTTDARGALRTPSQDSLGVSEVHRLMARLRFLAESRDTLLPARMCQALSRDAALLEYHASIHARCLTLEQDALREQLARLRRAQEDRALDPASLTRDVAQHKERLVAEYSEKIEATLAELLDRARGYVDGADLHELTNTFPGAMRTGILEVAHRLGATLREDLDRVSDELITTHGDLAQRRVLASHLRIRFETQPVFIEPPSALVEVGSLALGITGTVIMYFGGTVPGMLMTVASPLASMMLRERSVKEARAQSNAQLPEAIEATQARLTAASIDVIHRALEALERQIKLARAELGEQLEAILADTLRKLETHEAADEEANEPSETASREDGDGQRRARAIATAAALQTELSSIASALRRLSTSASRPPTEINAPRHLH